MDGRTRECPSGERCSTPKRSTKSTAISKPSRKTRSEPGMSVSGSLLFQLSPFLLKELSPQPFSAIRLRQGQKAKMECAKPNAALAKRSRQHQLGQPQSLIRG